MPVRVSPSTIVVPVRRLAVGDPSPPHRSSALARPPLSKEKAYGSDLDPRARLPPEQQEQQPQRSTDARRGQQQRSQNR